MNELRKSLARLGDPPPHMIKQAALTVAASKEDYRMTELISKTSVSCSHELLDVVAEYPSEGNVANRKFTVLSHVLES